MYTLTWLPVKFQNSELQSVVHGKLLVCGKLRAAVQRSSVQSYPTVIIELCNVMHIVECFAITKEQKHPCQYCKCVKIEDFWLIQPTP
jgi:hypothetical protein